MLLGLCLDSLPIQRRTFGWYVYQGPNKMKRPASRDKYRAIQDAENSWSVVDNDTELAYRVRDVPMVLLTEDTATALAEILNDINSDDRTIH